MDLTQPQIYNRLLDNLGNVWRPYLMDIGAWDMVTYNQIYVVHGLVASKIRDFQAYILGDVGEAYELGLRAINIGYGIEVSGSIEIDYTDPTRFKLVRFTAALFENIAFNDPTMNRGYIALWYIE